MLRPHRENDSSPQQTPKTIEEGYFDVSDLLYNPFNSFNAEPEHAVIPLEELASPYIEPDSDTPQTLTQEEEFNVDNFFALSPSPIDDTSIDDSQEGHQATFLCPIERKVYENLIHPSIPQDYPKKYIAKKLLSLVAKIAPAFTQTYDLCFDVLRKVKYENHILIWCTSKTETVVSDWDDICERNKLLAKSLKRIFPDIFNRKHTDWFLLRWVSSNLTNEDCKEIAECNQENFHAVMEAALHAAAERIALKTQNNPHENSLFSLAYKNTAFTAMLLNDKVNENLTHPSFQKGKKDHSVTKQLYSLIEKVAPGFTQIYKLRFDVLGNLRQNVHLASHWIANAHESIVPDWEEVCERNKRLTKLFRHLLPDIYDCNASDWRMLKWLTSNLTNHDCDKLEQCTADTLHTTMEEILYCAVKREEKQQYHSFITQMGESLSADNTIMSDLEESQDVHDPKDQPINRKLLVQKISDYLVHPTMQTGNPAASVTRLLIQLVQKIAPGFTQIHDLRFDLLRTLINHRYIFYWVDEDNKNAVPEWQDICIKKRILAASFNRIIPEIYDSRQSAWKLLPWIASNLTLKDCEQIEKCTAENIHGTLEDILHIAVKRDSNTSTALQIETEAQPTTQEMVMKKVRANLTLSNMGKSHPEIIITKRLTSLIQMIAPAFTQIHDLRFDALRNLKSNQRAYVWITKNEQSALPDWDKICERNRLLTIVFKRTLPNEYNSSHPDWHLLRWLSYNLTDDDCKQIEKCTSENIHTTMTEILQNVIKRETSTASKQSSPPSPSSMPKEVSIIQDTQLVAKDLPKAAGKKRCAIPDMPSSSTKAARIDLGQSSRQSEKNNGKKL